MPCGAAACVGVAAGGDATTAGAWAGAAAGDWAKVLVQWRKRRKIENEESKYCGFIFMLLR
jgi:hypothetical protein